LSAEAAEAAKAMAAEKKSSVAPAATFSLKPAPPSAAAPAAPKTADMSAEAARVVRAEAGTVKGESAKGDTGLWDAVRRNLEGKKKTVLPRPPLPDARELREGEFVIACDHEMMLDRLKEKTSGSRSSAPSRKRPSCRAGPVVGFHGKKKPGA